MVEMSKKTKEQINNLFLNKMGMSYEEFSKLDFVEQQNLIIKSRKKLFLKCKEKNFTLIGNGEHQIIYVVGDTPKKAKQRLDDRWDDISYSKPVAFVKKLTRRIKKDKV